MKKTALLYCAVALALGFTACDDYEEPNPPAQSNPQEPLLGEMKLSISDVAASGKVDLSTYNTANEGVPVLVVDTIMDCPEGYGPKFVARLSKDESFAEVIELPTTVTGNVVTIAPDAWEGAHVKMFGKSPKAKTTYLNFDPYLVNGTSSVRLTDPGVYVGACKIDVTPLPSSVVIEDNYYLVGTACNWTVADGIQFKHSAANVYDDPVFTLKVEITADQAAEGWWWKIVPQSVYALGDWGSGENSQFGPADNGDEALEGLLVGTDPGAGCIKEAGKYSITINMEESSYKFEKLPDVSVLYTPGNSNGWNGPASQQLQSTNAVNYSGYAYLDGEFKFAATPDWSGDDWGKGDTAGSLVLKGGNLSVEPAALYWCNVDLDALTYSLTAVNTIGIVGNATPGGWDADTEFVPSNNFLTWTATVHMTAGEWKFRANGGWDINLGGDIADLTQGGNNLVMTEEGDYEIVLNLNVLPYSCTLTKK